MLTRREQKELRALRQHRRREAEGRFLAEGIRVVEDLLASQITTRLVVQSSSLEDSPRGQALIRELDRRGIVRRTVSDAELEELAATRSPQGVLAIAEIPRWHVSDIQPGDPPVALLVLDAVQDPGNLGTLIRTAEALGALSVILLPGTADPWNPKSVRAAAGSAFRVPIVPSRWDELGPWLREHDFRTLVAASDGVPLPADPPAHAALVVGNEGAGVSGATRDHADATIGIPLRGRAESLNVAAAAAILLHQLLR